MNPNDASGQCTCGSQSKFDYTELDQLLENVKDMPGNLIIILQQAQNIYGYLPREVLTYISKKTGNTLAKIYGVATFYTQFRLNPIGKNLIMLCQGTACHVSGSQEIEAVINDELGIFDGETTEDGIFTLNNVACLGCCSLAPVMMVQSSKGEETYGKLTKEKVLEIIQRIKEENSKEA
ncbi:complex I 24 kDa subunit family protein [Sinanaerobacter chloroacetimidivorans]|jgi:NADH:ubiquinone oxidoreductase subunit E|uniref:NAD(P)H-dependent oxidoreductase subunit E n=1 Tax=Sinanaerobacter chloroacetimidivorans TaxID=2818044 RepID=A0A8J7W4E8_9FIRM|nr:NAD(P)H-dependent oxidoreductase subunit E [Sinanaerobacter chloroacetimidivorans]MBR0598876.1 NAD(P)H-dependent oxidoreductase subunit E [Sinanaerobacter chloroacetimidivorans]